MTASTSSSNRDRGSDQNVNIAQWIASAIADTGCTVVYGGHGGTLVPLVNAIVAHPSLTWVCARNEHDAATMAAAHAKLTGGLGVVMATSGPGATNLTTGLLEATLDGVSVLAITGLKPTAVIGYSEFQDINQSRLFAGAGLEWSKDAASADAVIPLLRDAVATALSRRTCAHLAIPVDIQTATSPLRLQHFCASHANLRLQPPAIDADYIQAAAATLVGTPHEARPPRNIIAVGLRGGVYDGPDMSGVILDLAEALNAPVVTRLHAKGVVDETHPLSFSVVGVHGKPGLQAAATLISTADRVISIGVQDETLLLCNSAGLQIRKLIEIQPDALAVGTRYNADHTLLGNVKRTVQALTREVQEYSVEVCKKRSIERHHQQHLPSSVVQRDGSMIASDDFDQFGYMAFHNPNASIVATAGSDGESDGRKRLVLPNLQDKGLEEVYAEAETLWDAMHGGDWNKLDGYSNNKRFVSKFEPSPEYCHPSSVLQALSDWRLDSSTDAVSKNAVVCVDVGDVTLWASLCLHLCGGSRTLYSERLGTMGYALNAGVAAILARPAPAGAVVLAGDGGLQMSIQELATFQQMKRAGDKLLVIVLDNQVLGRVAFGFENAAGCELGGPDYVALVRAYGGHGVLLQDDANAAAVVRDALAHDGLFVLHVRVDPHVKADMASFKDTTLQVMNSG